MGKTRTRISAKTPSGTALSRDEWGVVHIEGADLQGLYWGMGYAHAMDRGLQMLITRTLGQGRACECLKSDDEMLGVDRFFRRMNWSGRMDNELAQLDEETRELVEAYCSGANARFRKKIPWELRLLGFRYEPWRVEDVLLMTRMIGYINLAQSQGDLERLFVEMVQAGVDDARLDALFPGCLEKVDRATLEKVHLGERIVKNSALWGVAPRAIASNSWVVHGSRTKSGMPIMANDPHLEVNRLPNVWCEQVLNAPGIEAICATMPGIPGPLIGRNKHLAWGATYTFMDAVDSWMEDCKGGQYRRGETWVDFEVRKETIRRKKDTPIEVIFYENQHGVLDGDPHQEGLYLATRWSASESGAQSLMAAKDMWSAVTVEDGMAALGRLETAWNWVFAATNGDIGYQMSGLMPVRHEDWDGFVPAPGWDEAYDWKGFVDLTSLPRVINPPEGLIVTANQDLNHLGKASPINSPMGAWRATRIEAMLKESPKVDVALCKGIQNDVISLHAAQLMELLEAPLKAAVDPSGQGAALSRWDTSYDAPEAGLFEAIYQRLCARVFGHGVGDEAWATLRDETGIFTDFYDSFDKVLLDLDSPWWRDLDPELVLRETVAEALTQGAPPWSQSVRMAHLVFGHKLPAFLGFDVANLKLRGGRATPNQGQIYRSGGRETCFAPSIRVVVDLAEDGVHTALAGGPSDRRFSKWYTTDLERWQSGRYKVLSAAI